MFSDQQFTCPIITSASKCDQCFHESWRLLWNSNSVYAFLIYDVEKVLITQIKCDNCPIQRLRTLLQSRCNDLSAISFPFFSSRLIVSQLQMHRSISFSAPFSNFFFLSKYRSSTCIYIFNLGVLGYHQTPQKPSTAAHISL